MLQWICHLRPSHLSWENPEDIPFTNAVKKQFVRGTLTSLKSPLIVLCRPVLTVRTVITELGNLNAIKSYWIKGSWGQLVALITNGKVSMVTVMSSRIKAAIRID